jgi:hypothetical protein
MDRPDLWADYEQTLQTYRQLVDIRSKLLFLWDSGHLLTQG